MVQESHPDAGAPDSRRPVTPDIRRATDAAAEPGRLRLDALLAELMERAGEVLATQGRLRGLLDAVVTIAEDLSLDDVLRRLVTAACELVEARYGALGVVGPDRRTLTDFVTVGLTDDQIAAIGDLPHGQGILGVVIDQPEPLRLTDLAAHAKSYGFPPHHPPMSTFLGVPVRTRGRVFGNLYLTEKVGGKDFTEEDEQLVVALASAAGAAIQNAELFDAQRRQQRWLTASTEVRNLTLSGASRPDILTAVVDQCRVAAEADLVVLALCNTNKELVVAGVAGAAAEDFVGLDVGGADSLLARVAAERSPTDVDDLHSLAPGAWPEALEHRCERAIIVPLAGGDETGEALGALLVGFSQGGHRRPADDVSAVAGYASQAAVALRLARAQRDRERLAVLEDRDRIARDLHDLVIQRLFATGMTLQSMAPLVTDLTARGRLTTVVDDLDTTIRDLRQAIYQLQADALDEDLRADIQRVVDEASAGTPAQIRLHLVGLVATAVPDAVRGHLLAVLREALSNAVRHASASTIDVKVEVDRAVTLVIDDDGVGIDSAVSRRSGLANMQARAAEFSGSFDLGVGERGVGTRLTWQVPLDDGA